MPRDPYDLFFKMIFLTTRFDYNEKKLIFLALHTAQHYHQKQTRRSGEPYINHVVRVAITIFRLGFSASFVIAALLHDMIEDTPYELRQMWHDFNPDITILVDGVTRTNCDAFGTYQAKFRLVMADIPLAFYIRLADNDDNLNTPQFFASIENLIGHLDEADKLIWRAKTTTYALDQYQVEAITLFLSELEQKIYLIRQDIKIAYNQ